jgi:hypothetical protein
MNNILAFLATPFKVTMFACAWCSAQIDGKQIVIAMVENDDDRD